MNPFEKAESVASHWLYEIQRLRDRLRDRSGHGGTMLELIRPNLGHTPKPLRRVLEPVVAASAVVAILTLCTLGVMSFTLFLIAGALIYAILTKVFGLELGLEVPNQNP